MCVNCAMKEVENYVTSLDMLQTQTFIKPVLELAPQHVADRVRRDITAAINLGFHGGGDEEKAMAAMVCERARNTAIHTCIAALMDLVIFADHNVNMLVKEPIEA